MDMDFPVDLAECSRRIDDAEVLTIYFPMLGKTFLLDFRSTIEVPPLIQVVSRSKGPDERLRYLRRVRPSLPRPKDLTMIFWPRFVHSLVRLGIFERLLERAAASGYPSAVQACREALQELQQLERAEVASVIRGENYHTVWARKT